MRREYPVRSGSYPPSLTPARGRYHSHTGVDYQDGMRAPLVIHAEKEAHDYDDEFTIVLSDWYHERANKLNNKFMNKFNPTGAEPVPGASTLADCSGRRGAR